MENRRISVKLLSDQKVDRANALSMLCLRKVPGGHKVLFPPELSLQLLREDLFFGVFNVQLILALYVVHHGSSTHNVLTI